MVAVDFAVPELVDEAALLVVVTIPVVVVPPVVVARTEPLVVEAALVEDAVLDITLATVELKVPVMPLRL